MIRSVAIELVRMSVAVPCVTDMFSALPSSAVLAAVDAAAVADGSSTSTSMSTSPDVVCLSAACDDAGGDEAAAAAGDTATLCCWCAGDAQPEPPGTAGDVHADVAIEVGVIGGMCGGDRRMLTALAWAAAACWAAAAGEMRSAEFWAAWWARPRLLMAARLDGPSPSDGVK